MAPIKLVDAAKFYNKLPHQTASWDWLEGQISPEILNEFAKQYRSAPPAPTPSPSAALISASQCKAIFGRDITDSQLADLNSCLERFDIDTPDRIRHFMAQIAHESGGLQFMSEIWGPTPDQERYEGSRELGNTEPGDGSRFRGAGAIQLTGRYNYDRFARSVNDMGVMEGYTVVAEHYPFTSAGFWWNENHMNRLVDAGASCRQVSERVNGRDPAKGLEEREAYFAKAVNAIPSQAATTSAPASADGGMASNNPLAVPYFSQRDSDVSVQGKWQGDRMCFSSSCAMLLEFLKPNTLVGANGDDQYLKKVLTYGDTTVDSAQIQALESFGVKARKVETGDFSTIEQQINRGIPVPCGFLHHGHVDAPTGGGHWLCVVGYTPTHVYVNDPFGDLDLVNGGYRDVSGKCLLYSRKNFGRRWMVLNDGTYAPGHGWLILAEQWS
ncbi:MAG: C39 family peptidase [Synechococcaceae cyanobacterium]|jgi:predicted chitinase